MLHEFLTPTENSLPHLHSQHSGLAGSQPSTLPQLLQAAPMFLPGGTLNVPSLFHISVRCISGYLSLQKSYFLSPISSTKCHLLQEVSLRSTMTLSKARSTLPLDMWAALACLMYLHVLSKGSAPVVQRSTPSSAAAP